MEKYSRLYAYVVDKLRELEYEVTLKEPTLEFQITHNDDLVGIIDFGETFELTRYKRGSNDSIEDHAIHVSFIRVQPLYQGKHISYYLFILALLYSKINYPYIRKVVLEDCSDKSNEAIGNLYWKMGMSTMDLQELLYPNEVEMSMPVSRKRGSEHISIRCNERVGNIDVMIEKLQHLLEIDGEFIIKRGGHRTITKRRRKERKTKRRHANRKSRTTNKSY